MLQEQPQQPSLEKSGKKEYNFFFFPLEYPEPCWFWGVSFLFFIHSCACSCCVAFHGYKGTATSANAMFV